MTGHLPYPLGIMEIHIMEGWKLTRLSVVLGLEQHSPCDVEDAIEQFPLLLFLVRKRAVGQALSVQALLPYA